VNERAIMLNREFMTRGHRARDLDNDAIYVVSAATLGWAVDVFLEGRHEGSDLTFPRLKGQRHVLIEARERVRFLKTASAVSDVVRDAALAEAGFWR